VDVTADTKSAVGHQWFAIRYVLVVANERWVSGLARDGGETMKQQHLKFGHFTLTKKK
jgi:hypothetical protein